MVTTLTRVLTVGVLLLPALAGADKKIDDTVAKAIAQLEKNRDAKDEPLKNAEKLAKDGAANPEALLGAARIYVAVGKLDEARTAAAKAVDVSAAATPELRATALSQLAAIELRAGAGKDALAHAQEAAKLSQVPDVVATLARAQARVSDPSALKTAEDLVKTAPTSAAAHQAYGRALAASGKYDEALAEYTKALGIDPKDYNAQVAKAIALADTGHGAEAEAEARKAIALDPNQGEGFAVLGAALLAKDPKNPNAAVNEAVNGTFLTPSSAYIQYTVGRIHEAAGNLPPAKAAYEAAVKLDPNFAKARARLIQMQLWNNEIDAALVEARKLAEDQPNDGDAQLMFGLLLLKKSAYADALVPLERAAQRLPRNGDVHAALGTTYQYNHQPQDALAEYKQAVELVPGNIDYQTTYGLLLGVNKQYAPGIAVLEKVVRAPGYKDAAGYINLGWLYRNAEPPRALESVAAYKKALELDPKSSAAQLGLSWALYTAKNWAEAIAAFDKTAQVDPKLAGEANLASGWSQYWATVDAKSKDMSKARLAADKAKAALGPGDPRPGKLVAGIEHFEKAGQAEERSVRVERTQEDKPDLAGLVQKATTGPGPGRALAVRAMGALGAEAVPYLMQYLTDGNLHVRTAAAKSLGAVGAPAAKAVTYLQQEADKSRERVMLPPAGVSPKAEDVLAERELQEACQEAVHKISGK